MEKELEVLVPIEVGYECDVCKKGFMYYTGRIKLGFEHECSNCTNKQTLDIKYPTVKFKRKFELE